jgi:hypothetical protein
MLLVDNVAPRGLVLDQRDATANTGATCLQQNR